MVSTEIKIGDWVKQSEYCSGTLKDEIYEVVLSHDGRKTLRRKDGGLGCQCVYRWILQKSNLLNNLKNMLLLEKLQLALKSEPEKSFIKLGILNAKEQLTEEGEKLLLNWLLKENMKKFNDEVVSVIEEWISKEER